MRTFLILLVLLPITLILILIIIIPQPHYFIVKSYEAEQVMLRLNDQTSNMNNIGPYWFDSISIDDASGKITSIYADGTKADCIIGYISSAELNPKYYEFSDKKCVD